MIETLTQSPPHLLELWDEAMIPPEVITEDDTPVDNWNSEKQQRLLPQTLYQHKDELPFSWPFLVAANVGIFSDWHKPPIVPDVFLSLGVDVPQNWWRKGERVYFVPRFGKPPELVIEIVSNTVGQEDSKKMLDYAQLGVLYYVIYDPDEALSPNVLRAYQLQGHGYRELKHTWFAKLGLGLRLWEGWFEGHHETWLRWCDQKGQVFFTGSEQADEERLRRQWVEEQAELVEEQAEEARTQARLAEAQADHERLQRQAAETRAEQAETQADHERQQRQAAEAQTEHERQQRQAAEAQTEYERLAKEKLAAKLRELGIDPTTL